MKKSFFSLLLMLAVGCLPAWVLAGSGLTLLPGSSLESSEGALFKIFNKGASPRVKANLSYTGSGVLRGVWEIAEPSSTVGTAVFHPLTYVRKFLSQVGQITIYSPHLPGNMTGLYLVRFRITEPQPAFDAPVIRYFINAAKHAVKPVRMDIISPKNQARISEDTRFSWQQLNGARAYLLELFVPAAANPDQPATNTTEESIKSLLIPKGGLDGGLPVSGMLIPANQTILSKLAQTNLEAGHRYLWRVRAIDASGHVIGESPLRAIQVP